MAKITVCDVPKPQPEVEDRPVSPSMARYLRDNYCLTFGQCGLRNHGCIRNIEEAKEVCIKCQRMTVWRLNNGQDNSM